MPEAPEMPEMPDSHGTPATLEPPATTGTLSTQVAKFVAISKQASCWHETVDFWQHAKLGWQSKGWELH